MFRGAGWTSRQRAGENCSRSGWRDITEGLQFFQLEGGAVVRLEKPPAVFAPEVSAPAPLSPRTSRRIRRREVRIRFTRQRFAKLPEIPVGRLRTAELEHSTEPRAESH